MFLINQDITLIIILIKLRHEYNFLQFVLSLLHFINNKQFLEEKTLYISTFNGSFFLCFFEEGALRFHFALGPVDDVSGTSPLTSELVFLPI